MILTEWANEPLNGGLLYTVLNKHQLLPSYFSDPHACVAAATRMTIGFLHEGKEQPLAVMFESSPEPGVIGLMFITEVARLNQRRDELIEASRALRDRWFGEMGAIRVEARVPVERTQTIRCLKHMGFHIETAPKGLRNAVIYNGIPKSLCVMGLLPSDEFHNLSNPVKEPILTEGVGA
jgi:hypothetical protein